VEPDAAIVVGKALFPSLSRFHELAGKSLRGVWYLSSDGSLTQVALDFGRVSLVVGVVAADVTIDFKCADTKDLAYSHRR
jgi:hypothetical protein